MTDELKALVEKFRSYEMTPEELRRQAISFAYGNGHIEDERVTIEGIEKAMTDVFAEQIRNGFRNPDGSWIDKDQAPPISGMRPGLGSLFDARWDRNEPGYRFLKDK